MSAPHRVVLASGNAGKLRELAVLLEPLGVEILPQSAFGIEDADENGLSFVENALIKARHASAATGLPAIADDSGIEVDALEGAPGIHSARYAGPRATDRENLDKLLAAVAGVPDARRGARFVCLMVFLRHGADPRPVIAEGVWEGRLLRAPQGSGGFGYDPIFHVPTHGCASAELAPEEKNRLSHRGQAARALAQALAQRHYFDAG
ncbi:MAG: RdgB/HAM1 family non-canonical purine NTP pyrophosphatase [Gammaproteobacteria bacterium]